MKMCELVRKHAHFGDRWKSIVFADKKKFNLVGTNGYYRVWVERDQSFILEWDEHVKLRSWFGVPLHKAKNCSLFMWIITLTLKNTLKYWTSMLLVLSKKKWEMIVPFSKTMLCAIKLS